MSDVATKCPRCERKLSQQIVFGIEIDVCNGGCGGIWFDAFELKHLLASENTAEDQFSVSWDPSVPTNTGKLMCPRCTDTIMLNRPYPGHVNISIDECPKCGGFWLDRGELTQIREVTPEDSTKMAPSDRQQETATVAAHFSRKIHYDPIGVLGYASSESGTTTVGDWSDMLTGHPSRPTPWKTWGLGIVLASALMLLGLNVSMQPEITIHSRGSLRGLRVTGLAVVARGLMVVFMGFLLHFHYFWGSTKTLQQYAVPAKLLTFGLFITSLLVFLWKLVA